MTREKKTHSRPIAVMAIGWKLQWIHDGSERHVDGQDVAYANRRSSCAVSTHHRVCFDADLVGKRRMFYVSAANDLR